jgi:hypothetical protein
MPPPYGLRRAASVAPTCSNAREEVRQAADAYDRLAPYVVQERDTLYSTYVMHLD